MINAIDDIITIILSAVEATIFLIFFVTLIQNRGFFHTLKFKSILFIVFYTVFQYWASKYTMLGLHTAIMFIFTILILSFITRSSIYNAAIAVVITAIFIMLVDTIVSGIFMVIFNIGIDKLLNDKVIYPIFACTSKAVQMGLIVLLYNFDFSWLKIRIFRDNSNQYLLIFTQLFLMSLFFFSINYSIAKGKDIISYYILLGIIFLLTTILALYDIRERERLIRLSTRKESLDAYIRNLEDVINIIRREKHEFMNHINTIYAIGKMKKPDSLDKIDSYLGKLVNNLHSSYTYYDTGNIYVDGLLAVKSNVCHEKSIELTVRIGASLHYANADDCDLAGIVGNIINNAIECLERDTSKENKQIVFETNVKDSDFIISMKNNGPEISSINRKRIFENGFTTKSDSSEHGFGLFITQQLVEKNRGRITVNSDKNESEFKITFKVRRSNNELAGKLSVVQDQGVQS